MSFLNSMVHISVHARKIRKDFQINTDSKMSSVHESLIAHCSIIRHPFFLEFLVARQFILCFVVCTMKIDEQC
jgi:hypothetical protein